MLIKSPPPWQIPANQATPEGVFHDRRRLIKAMGLGLATASLWPASLGAAPQMNRPNLNPLYKDAGREVTKESLATSYNNFYEYSLDKERVKDLATSLPIDPWRVEVGGLVDHPMTLGMEEIYKMFPAEERIYRFRCVEAWSMVIPWDGFPIKKLLDKVSPKKEAKFVMFQSFHQPEKVQGQQILRHYPWPYTEGLTLAEASHDLALLVTGMYGKGLPMQNGAPLRLVVPWKYGFKSIKSITRIMLVDKMPQTLWNQLAPEEYGFYANVNPEVHHPRWSQGSERILGSFFGKAKTQLFNGYQKEVAPLYQGLDLHMNF